MAETETTETMSEALQRELDDLAKQSPDGLLRAEAMEMFARENEDTQLHKQLEWDDTIAGRMYRIQQCRQIIRCYVTRSDESAVKVRAYVSVSTDRVHGGGYRRIQDALRASDIRRQLLEDALKTIEGLPQRYSHLPELAPLWDDVQQLLRRHRNALGTAAPGAA